MSAWATTWAYEQDIKPCGKKAVLVALAHFADAEGYCYPSQETLAGMTSQGVSTVREHLAMMQGADGLIIREARYDKRGKRASDGFRLQAPAERLQPPKHYRRKPAVVEKGLNTPGVNATTAEKTADYRQNSAPLPPEKPNAYKDDLSEDLSVNNKTSARAREGLVKPIRKESAEEVAARDPNAADRLMLIDLLQERNGAMRPPKIKQQEAAINFLFGTGRSTDELIRCFNYLKTQKNRWAVTWQTVETEIGTWIEKGEPATDQNGNGANGKQRSQFETGADQSARNYKEGLARFGIGVSTRDRENSSQSATRQITPGPGPGRNGDGG